MNTLAPLAETAHRHRLPVDEGQYEVAIPYAFSLSDDDDVPVANLLLEQRVAPHGERIEIALAGEIFRYCHRLSWEHSVYRHTGRQVTKQWDIDRARAGPRR